MSRVHLVVPAMFVVACAEADLNEAAYCADYTFDDTSAEGIEESGFQQFTEDGRLLRQETDSGDDGTVDSTNTLTWSADEVENVFESTPLSSTGVRRRANDVLASFTVDNDGDGVLDSELQPVETNDDGDPTEQLYRFPDSSLRWFRAYDDEQRQTRLETDEGDDGSIDEVRTWTYTEARIVEEQDAGADGSIERVWETDLDGEGRIVEERAGKSGEQPDVVTTWTWSDGLLVAKRSVSDGKVGDTYAYTYDDEGRVLTEDYVDELTGAAWTTTTSYLDCP